MPAHLEHSIFTLPDELHAKGGDELIGADERHLALVVRAVEQQIGDASEHLLARGRDRAGVLQQSLERDVEMHRLAVRLRTLRRFARDLCLGRMVHAETGDITYIGRIGVGDGQGGVLLVDWRAPAAEPFFAATLAAPMGLASRRRYRWDNGCITDYWDEVFDPAALAENPALDADSAFLAGLAAPRTGVMPDVLATIQADQDAIIRAGSRGALVVDGGPGTGKTVVALHRAAYLMYADARIGPEHGGILFLGPHPAYTSYVADVLPNLGEDAVLLSTLDELVPEHRQARAETDAGLARLKASLGMVHAVEQAISLHEMPPERELRLQLEEQELVVHPADWAEAIDLLDAGLAHNEARGPLWQALLEVLCARHPQPVRGRLRRQLEANVQLRQLFEDTWPLMDAPGVLAALYSVEVLLRYCAPQLRAGERARLLRAEPRAWTVEDLPLLDAARQRLGDPRREDIEQQRRAVYDAERARMDAVVSEILQYADDKEDLGSQLVHDDLREQLVDENALPGWEPDPSAGPFAHIVIDEAQELTDAQWLMVLRRCPSGSLTIVGDRAQARQGFAEPWAQRLARVGITGTKVRRLQVNYRTPAPVMEAAAEQIRGMLPDANIPLSIRRDGHPVRYGSLADLDPVLDDWFAAHPLSVTCVIGDIQAAPRERVSHHSPATAKGLEFDLVVVIDPDSFGEGITGAVDRYVAMTRATAQLVVLTG